MGIPGIDVRNDTLTGAHVASNSLPGADLTDNSVTSAKIADTSVTAADVAPVQSPLQPQLEVHLEGAVGCSGNANEGTVIFNFPPGFCPPVFSVLRYGGLGGGGARLVYDGPDGDAIDNYISLDGITFRTEG
jgi:hypothetical protein